MEANPGCACLHSCKEIVYNSQKYDVARAPPSEFQSFPTSDHTVKSAGLPVNKNPDKVFVPHEKRMLKMNHYNATRNDCKGVLGRIVNRADSNHVMVSVNTALGLDKPISMAKHGYFCSNQLHHIFFMTTNKTALAYQTYSLLT